MRVYLVLYVTLLIAFLKKSKNLLLFNLKLYIHVPIQKNIFMHIKMYYFIN